MKKYTFKHLICLLIPIYAQIISCNGTPSRPSEEELRENVIPFIKNALNIELAEDSELDTTLKIRNWILDHSEMYTQSSNQAVNYLKYPDLSLKDLVHRARSNTPTEKLPMECYARTAAARKILSLMDIPSRMVIIMFDDAPLIESHTLYQIYDRKRETWVLIESNDSVHYQSQNYHQPLDIKEYLTMDAEKMYPVDKDRSNWEKYQHLRRNHERVGAYILRSCSGNEKNSLVINEAKFDLTKKFEYGVSLTSCKDRHPCTLIEAMKENFSQPDLDIEIFSADIK